MRFGSIVGASSIVSAQYFEAERVALTKAGRIFPVHPAGVMDSPRFVEQTPSIYGKPLARKIVN
jgi:hypothetical protein